MSHTAILSLTDFERIKRNAKFQTKEEEKNIKTIEYEQQNAQQSKARVLKDKLLNIDCSKMNKFESLDNIKESPYLGNTVLNQAKRILDDNEDCVKQMNKFFLYAKTASIRDRQLSERKVLDDIYKRKEGKVDLMIELERLKEIKCKEEKDHHKKILKREGSLIIIDQIKEKDLERLREKEQVDREGIAIAKQIITLEQENKRLIEKKKVHEEQIAKEIIDANKFSSIIRQKKKLDEKEVELKISLYNMEKVKKEEDQIAIKIKRREEKEKELQRLREKQEREQDKKAELDSLREKRAFEENEIQLRIKEKEESLIKQKRLNDLYIDNEKQRMNKEIKLAEQAQLEHNEYEKIVKKQMEEIEAERRKEEERKKKKYEHSYDLRKQMKIKEGNGFLSRRGVIEEGRAMKQKMDNYRMRMEAIKQEKLKELQSLSIDQKYIDDLERYIIK